jgi:hypothetical protein
MQRYLLSKAATMKSCSPPLCRIKTYLQPLYRPPSPISIFANQKSLPATHSVTNYPDLEAGRLIDSGGLGVQPTTTSEAQLKVLQSAAASPADHDVSQVDTQRDRYALERASRDALRGKERGRSAGKQRDG